MGRSWGLDPLGNWSVDLDAFTQHDTDEINRITSRVVDDTPGDGTAGDTAVTNLDLEAQGRVIATTKGHQGLDHMPEIDAVDNRARILKPKYGRWRCDRETS